VEGGYAVYWVCSAVVESSFVLEKQEERLAVGRKVEQVGLQITKGTNAVLSATVPIFYDLSDVVLLSVFDKGRD
jgi:hypothetical protein